MKSDGFVHLSTGLCPICENLIPKTFGLSHMNSFSLALKWTSIWLMLHTGLRQKKNSLEKSPDYPGLNQSENHTTKNRQKPITIHSFLGF